jgi:hypothetical protein
VRLHARLGDDLARGGAPGGRDDAARWALPLAPLAASLRCNRPFACALCGDRGAGGEKKIARDADTTLRNRLGTLPQPSAAGYSLARLVGELAANATAAARGGGGALVAAEIGPERGGPVRVVGGGAFLSERDMLYFALKRALAFCEVSSRVRAVLWRSNATVLCRRGRVRGGDLLRGHDPAACGLSPDLDALGDPAGPGAGPS